MIIERQRGDTYLQKFRIVDDTRTPISLTTESFIMSVSSEENPTGAPDILSVSGTILDGPNGRISFPIDGTQPIGNYFFDVQMTTAGGEITTVAKGQFNVLQDITK